ncbi:MAG: hypothetical protein DI584_13025 [Stenotrophomonas sp.]|nr:MAG: hypothetical protein DI584_13025 [Stenotrophomonas sp.]
MRRPLAECSLMKAAQARPSHASVPTHTNHNQPSRGSSPALVAMVRPVPRAMIRQVRGIMSSSIIAFAENSRTGSGCAGSAILPAM